MNDFLQKLFQFAREAGIEAFEAFLLSSESFEAVSTEGEITQYSANSTRGLGFRGMVNGKMGYAATEAFDDSAISQLVHGVLDSARLIEDEDTQFLYQGTAADPELDLQNPALADVTPEQKLNFALQLEKEAKSYDARVEKVGDSTIATGSQTLRIINSYGVDKQYTEDFCGAYLQPIAKEGESVSSSMELQFGRDFSQLDAKALGAAAAKLAVDGLHSAPVPSGSYRVLLENKAMAALLGVFAPVFSAENAQKGLSLLKGKLGEVIAAPGLTLVDDPLRKDGLASRPFDGEGVPSERHTIISDGVFCTFLHNLKTAYKDGVQTTGNASRDSYASSVRVSPSNFFLEPGKKSLSELMEDAKSGLVIQDLSGLHAGADPISGDFSLLAKGYAFQKGKRTGSVEQIIVAGNFFTLLKGIQAVGSDLRFPQGGMGSPSVDAGMLTIAGA